MLMICRFRHTNIEIGGGNKSYPPFLLTLKRINMLDYQTIDETIKATLLDKKGSGATPKVKTGGYDVSSGFLAMLQKTLESQVKKTSKKASEALQESSSDSLTSKTNPKELEVGDQFFGSITTTKKNEAGKKSRYKPIDYWKVIKKEKNEATGNTSFTVENPQGEKYKTSPGGINMQNPSEHQEKLRKLAEKLKAEEEEKKRKAEEEAKMIDMSKLQPHEQLKKLIEAGMRNIWMVGPAGCGKSTMARMTAKELNLPYLCISCGIGTSATEFLGYKYPTRESTKFAEYYAKPSIILIDEMTALDPAVGQVLNAALANDEIETTTGLVSRNPECIIIATSNTFGSGASRQYVANNQLDASTIDRFIGGIIEVDYSVDYESQYDVDVVNYVWKLRECIKACNIRRIASTRMIQSGTRMKKAYFKNWKDMLICNWTDTEREIVKKFFTPENKERITESKELDSSGRTKVFFG
jgi:DNA replication protein DnaC